jgi:branched-chain amino acid transport system ATP-binding protein
LEESESTLLKIEHLSVFYGHIRALAEVDVEVVRGEFLALIGANGAGKSTLLESILGLHRSRTGEIRFQGRDITRLPTERIVAQGIALCPEGRGILPEMSVKDNLLLGAYHNRGMIPSGLERVYQYFPSLKESGNRKAGSLSGGQQQMLSIGRAIMASPALLMMDEPSLGLAPIVVNELFRVIRTFAEEGHTIMLSEQNAMKSLQYAQRAYVFETGKIVLEGLCQDLIENGKVVQAYLGAQKRP